LLCIWTIQVLAADVMPRPVTALALLPALHQPTTSGVSVRLCVFVYVCVHLCTFTALVLMPALHQSSTSGVCVCVCLCMCVCACAFVYIYCPGLDACPPSVNYDGCVCLCVCVCMCMCVCVCVQIMGGVSLTCMCCLG